MFYELERGRVGIITFSELKDDYVMYGFPQEMVFECERNQHNFRSNNYVTNDMIFIVLDLINLLDVFAPKNRVAIFVQKQLCLIVCVKDDDGMIREQFEKVMQRYSCDGHKICETVPEKFLYHFLNDLMLDDRKFLENMEFQMSGLETRMMYEKVTPTIIHEILMLKKELMYIWNYYEQLIDVGEVLRDNENDMFPDENVRRFAIFTERAQRISENVKYLKEYTVQLQEMHDAMLDYNLNRIMKLFTVITAFFSPLTLIVGWYGMNFQNMPELSWKYGYFFVLLLCFMSVVGCVAAFKRYKLL